MQLTNEDWKYKIINASETRLVIVSYELILDRMKSAKAALSAGDMEGFRESLNNAKEFVTEMVASLDFQHEVAKDMANLYFYVNKLITKSFFSKDTKPLDDAYAIIEKLMNGLVKEVDDGKAPQSVQSSSNYSNIGK